MSKALDDLHPKLRPLAFELLARAVEAGINPVVIDTLRSAAEHAADLEAGTSWIKVSKHQPDADGFARAIDVAPAAVLPLKAWAPGHAHWKILGAIGEKLGLRWGGRWPTPDNAHFELKGKG